MRVTPRIIRWAGLAGSVATAASAYLGGSGVVREPSVNPVTLLSGARGFLLPVCWLVGTVLLIGAWWSGLRVVPSLRWVLVTVGLWYLPVLPFLPLGSADVYSYACQGYVQYAGGDPYAGGVAEFGCPWLSSVASSWAHSPAPYGPLFLLLAAASVGIAGTSVEGVIAGLRVIALAGLVLVAIGLPVLARRAGTDPARAVWLVLACPLVLVHLVSGAHNDALMVGLIVVGLVATSRPDTVRAAANPGGSRRPLVWLVAGGLLLGFAVSVKATAIVVVPFAVLAAVPPGSPPSALRRPALAIGGALIAAVGLLSAISGRGFGSVAGLLRSGDTVAWTSPSTAVGMSVEYAGRLFGARIDAVGATRVAGVAVLAVLLAVLWRRARRRGALGGAGLALAATVCCAPVFHPWYATWPLAVLAAAWAERPTGARAPAGVAGTAQPPDGGVRTGIRWLLGLCAFAATLTTPAGYNWALYTRIPGALMMTAALVVLGAVVVRRVRPSGALA